MWKKTIVWTVLTLASLFAIVLVIVAIDIYVTGKRLDKKLTEIRATGAPMCIADLAPAAIPDDQDGAVLLDGIRDDLRAFNRQLEDYTKSENYASGCPTDSQLEAIEAAFAAYPKVLPAVQKAAALKGYQWGLDYSQSPQLLLASLGNKVATHQEATRVLTLHASVLRAHDQWDEAAVTAVPVLRMAKHFEHDRTLVFFLMALFKRATAIDVANKALRGGPVSEKTRNLLEREFAKTYPCPAYLDALKGERAYALDCFRHRHFSAPIRWYQRTREQLNYLDLVDAYIQAAPAPYYQQSVPFVYPGTSGHQYAETVQPPLQLTRDVVEQSRVRVRALRVFIALMGHEDPNAASPLDLSELGLPKDATTDPFNGQPLIVKKLPEGWKVYSVGANLTDDGGKLDGHTDVGVGPIQNGIKSD